MSCPFELLARFLAVPSPSGSEGAYAALLTEVLQARGYEVEADEVAPGRPNLIAKPPGVTPRVYYSTHIDVVPPEIEVRRDGDRFYGRGSADTKGPLVAMLHAADRLAAEGHQVGFVLVVGEEVDHCGAIRAAEAPYDLGPDATILLGEPTSNRLVAAQKGLLSVTARAVGQAGHSAFPDRGVSAIHRLLDFLDAVRREPWPDDDQLGPTTFNIGRIAGGVANNVFAPAAEASLLFRLVRTAEETLGRLDALRTEGVTIETVSQNDPLRIAVPDGFETTIVPFNTDARWLGSLGTVWLCGPGAIEVAHSEHEHIDLPDLERGIETYAALARAALGV